MTLKDLPKLMTQQETEFFVDTYTSSTYSESWMKSKRGRKHVRNNLKFDIGESDFSEAPMLGIYSTLGGSTEV